MQTTLSKQPDGTFSITAMEIFRVGDYGEKGSYSEADLDAVAADYKPTAHEAPLTVDHEQTGPAFGWVSRVWREGESLLCDIKQVPAEMADMLRQGTWKKRSVELYRKFQGTMRPYLKAVSLLGAAAPHVKGMRDLQFAEGSPSESFDFEAPTIRFFDAMEAWPRPDGVSTGVLSRIGDAGNFLGHSHRVAVDDLGNGFTSAPETWDEGIDRWRHLRAGEPGFHQHVIIGGRMQPADDGRGNQHTHPFGGSIAMSDKPSGAPAPASNPQNPAPAANPSVTLEQFNELKAKLEAAEAASKRMADALVASEARAANDKALAAFDAAFAGLLAEGKVAPAERDGLLATFMALPKDSAEPVKFTDAAGKEVSVASPRAAFLEGLNARQARTDLTKAIGETRFSESTDPNAKDAQRLKRADEILAERKKTDPSFSRQDAIVEAFREIK